MGAMSPKRTTNAQRRTAPVTILPPAEAARVVLGFSPEPLEPGAVVNVGLEATRGLVVLRLVIPGPYVELFDVVDLIVAGRSAIDSHGGRGVTARAFHDDKGPQLPALRAETGESILLRLRNRTTKPQEFRGWIVGRPTEGEITLGALPEPARRVR
jgi:hypothetical protein